MSNLTTTHDAKNDEKHLSTDCITVELRSLDDFLKYVKKEKDIPLKCPHIISDKVLEDILTRMPYSSAEFNGYHKPSKETQKAILLWFGHNNRYSDHSIKKLNGCSFQIPFDHKLTYNGETALFCGHGYSGYVSTQIHYFKEAHTFASLLAKTDADYQEDDRKAIFKELAKWQFLNGNSTLLNVWYIGVVRLRTYVPETYDNDDFIKPNSDYRVYRVERIEDNSTKEIIYDIIWCDWKVALEQFEIYRTTAYDI